MVHTKMWLCQDKMAIQSIKLNQMGEILIMKYFRVISEDNESVMGGLNRTKHSPVT